MPPVSRRGRSSPLPTPILSTSREVEGYDFIRNGRHCWFEAWGTGPKADWTTRAQAGRPPSPDELMRAEYIVVGVEGGNPPYITMIGGMDL